MNNTLITILTILVCFFLTHLYTCIAGKSENFTNPFPSGSPQYNEFVTMQEATVPLQVARATSQEAIASTATAVIALGVSQNAASAANANTLNASYTLAAAKSAQTVANTILKQNFLHFLLHHRA